MVTAVKLTPRLKINITHTELILGQLVKATLENRKHDVMFTGLKICKYRLDYYLYTINVHSTGSVETV